MDRWCIKGSHRLKQGIGASFGLGNDLVARSLHGDHYPRALPVLQAACSSSLKHRVLVHLQHEHIIAITAVRRQNNTDDQSTVI